MPNRSRRNGVLRRRNLQVVGPEKKAVGSLLTTDVLQTRIRSAFSDEVDRAFMLLLNEEGLSPQELSDRVRGFKDIVAEGGYDLSCLQVVEHGREIVHSGFYVAQAGGTAMMLSSAVVRAVADDNSVRQNAIESLRGLSERAFGDGSKLLQVMIDPLDAARRELCLDGGFEYLTDLSYLACLTSAPLDGGDLGAGLHWLSYDEQNHDLFAHAILRSYINSMDCQELEPFRDIEDIIVGHKAAGSFDPSLWRLLVKGGTPVGILLLSPIPSRETLELTYMGVDPEFRRMGLGCCLLKEALATACRSGAKSLSLAVDCRNKPAIDMYKSCGLIEILRRAVLLKANGRGLRG